MFLATGAFFSFFTFATPLLIHWISKKYVTDLYYNTEKDSYTAYTYTLLLRKKKVRTNNASFFLACVVNLVLFQLEFRPADVEIPELPSMFTTFKAHDVPLFVDASQFTAVEHYGKIMGYDKPISMRMEDGVTELEARARRIKKEKGDS